MKIQTRLSGAEWFSKHMLPGLVLFCVTVLLLSSCSSTPKYPVYPEPLTRVLPASHDSAFLSVLKVLRNDDRLELHTIDKAGRFLAWEKAAGFFVFFRQRTVLEIELKPEGADATHLSMRLTAESYDTGGLTREAGWYPSSKVDTLLGDDILRLIEAEIAKSHS